MIRLFFRLLTQAIALAIVAFALTGVYVVYDGLNDKGDTADCAVVLGHALKTDGQPGLILQERLDRAVKLYYDKKVPLVIVSGGREFGGADEAAGMAKYLKAHGVPGKAIVEDPNGAHTAETAHDVAAIMRKRDLHSVMIVTHYYHITRTKVALQHEGIHQISQAHVGTLARDDSFNVVREAGALWYYIVQKDMEPAAAKASVQAMNEALVLKTKLQAEASGASGAGGSTVLGKGLFSYQAPAGWSVVDEPESKYPICKGPSEDGFVPSIQVVLNHDGMALSDYVAQDLNELKNNRDVQKLKVLDQRPYTTASGLEGIRVVTTCTMGTHDQQVVEYTFDCGSDNKMVVTAECPAADASLDLPLFDGSLRTLSLE